MQTEKQIIEKFIVDTIVINPINEIIEKLKNNLFYNHDIKYLKFKLKEFTKLALELLNINLKVSLPNLNVLNDYNTKRFISYFEILLKYFKQAE